MLEETEMKCGLQALKSERHGLRCAKPAPFGVIIATISNETALPNSLLAAVIAMNPAAAKSAAVHEAIEGKTNPLTNYQKTLIEAARQDISPKELIKEQMAHAYCQMQRAKAELKATAPTTADAIGYLEDTKFMQDRWIKADLLYASGDIAAANSLLLNSGAYFNLSTDAQAELVAYSDYKTTEQAILSRENSTLTPAEETYLLGLYDNDVYGLGILAINLLNAFGGHDLMLAIPDAPPGNYHSLTNTNEARIPVVSVYPNPAQNFVVINTTELVPATIKLMQWDGKEVLNTTTQGVRDEIVLNLQDIEQGVYVLLLYSEAGELLYQTNIIKK
jgi:Secretion system C-terminal sorting domain